MYEIVVIYDTGDSFHTEHDVEHTLELKWEKLEQAKKALVYLEEHYFDYMILHKEWNAGKEEKDKALNHAKSRSWFYQSNYWTRIIMLENDNGELTEELVTWTGYFEHLVGADIRNVNNTGGLSFRT